MPLLSDTSLHSRNPLQVLRSPRRLRTPDPGLYVARGRSDGGAARRRSPRRQHPRQLQGRADGRRLRSWTGWTPGDGCGEGARRKEGRRRRSVSRASGLLLFSLPGAEILLPSDINADRLAFAKSYAASDTFLPPALESGEKRMDYSRRATKALQKELGLPERGVGSVDLVIEASGAEVCIQVSRLPLSDILP